MAFSGEICSAASTATAPAAMICQIWKWNLPTRRTIIRTKTTARTIIGIIFYHYNHGACKNVSFYVILFNTYEKRLNEHSGLPGAREADAHHRERKRKGNSFRFSYSAASAMSNIRLWIPSPIFCRRQRRTNRAISHATLGWFPHFNAVNGNRHPQQFFLQFW